MEVNEQLRDSLFEAVDDQLKNNDPPEAKMAYDRLKNNDYDDLTIRQLLAQCVLVEIVEIMNGNENPDRSRLIQNLNNLPKEPVEDE
jgi:hypothetical protein